ncbi:MAG TPA: hypothetical protein VE344_05880 [Methylomirabilota bacterium]|nr:hypothetical protein [Methylomirabilota bacterium]
MADIPPNIPGAPLGAVPPQKKETGKVQPKKETVRINLPPKPSAAPTIKLPTLPPGGPTGAPSAAPTQIIRTAAPPPRTAAAPAAGRPTTAAPPAPRTAAPRPVSAAATTIGTLDKILAIAAMVAALFAVGSALYLMFGITIGS